MDGLFQLPKRCVHMRRFCCISALKEPLWPCNFVSGVQLCHCGVYLTSLSVVVILYFIHRVVMKAGMERNGMELIGARAMLKIVLNRLCAISNCHTITRIMLELVCFCL